MVPTLLLDGLTLAIKEIRRTPSSEEPPTENKTKQFSMITPSSVKLDTPTPVRKVSPPKPVPVRTPASPEPTPTPPPSAAPVEEVDTPEPTPVRNVSPPKSSPVRTPASPRPVEGNEIVESIVIQ
ncbi:uncharacterized protein [Amphiura filiformis]|uniref:uncharacterized protein n=1 Tax=Amphiura filiformis TaxID=82378 RepID=UPI003B20E8E7